VLALLDDAELRAKQVAGLTQLRGMVRQGADKRAAEAVLALAASRRRTPV